MPTYEYGCKACGHEFEREQRISDDPIKTCPKCKSRQARRLISRTSFVLKGSGWYSDLYSSPGKSEAGSDKDTGKAAGGSDKGSSADSKSSSKKGGDSKRSKSPGSKGGAKATRAA